MEPVGAFFDEELDSINRMLTNMDADFMMQLHENGIFFNDRGNGMGFETSSLFPPSEAYKNVAFVDESLFSSNTFNPNSFSYFSQESSSNSETADNVFFPNPSNEHNQANDVNIVNVTNDTPESSMEFYVMDNRSENSIDPVFSDEAMDDILNLKEEIINAKSGNADSQPMAVVASDSQQKLKRKFDSPEEDELISNDSSDNPKKKSRVLRDTQKSRRNAQPKKNKRTLHDGKNEDENETNAGKDMQISSPSISENDSNASQELNGGETSNPKGPAALKSNAKTRASRGSATDPQSLYARKRRERINERLKVLQTLVPNGTKVDISTMLEEAVQYVKFLQLQIKLLSSDDLWMYAPIAYNGMDIGAYQRMFPTS